MLKTLMIKLATLLAGVGFLYLASLSYDSGQHRWLTILLAVIGFLLFTNIFYPGPNSLIPGGATGYLLNRMATRRQNRNDKHFRDGVDGVGGDNEGGTN